MDFRHIMAGGMLAVPSAARVTRSEMTDEERFRIAEEEWKEMTASERLKALRGELENILHDLAHVIARTLAQPDVTELERMQCRAGLEALDEYIVRVVQPRWITERVFAMKDRPVPF